MAELMMFNPVEAFGRGQTQGYQNALMREQMEMRKRRPDLIRNALTTGNTADLVAEDPAAGAQVQQYLASLSKQEQERFQQMHEASLKELAFVESLPPEQRASAYAAVAPRINQRWGRDALPAQYDPVQVGLVLAQGRSISDMLKPQQSGDPFKIETDLRKELDGLTADFRKQKAAFGRIRASAKDPSAAGDLALIFNYMKLLDPGSVVRESEFATAQNAAGVPDRVRNLYNRVLSGERLGEMQRADFVRRAGMLYNDAVAGFNDYAQRYRRLAEQQQANPANVAELWEPIDVAPVAQQEDVPPPDELKPGMVLEGYRYKGGNPADKNSWVKVNG